MEPDRVTTPQAAKEIGVSSATLKRWLDRKVIPGPRGRAGWTPAEVAQARMAARLRERGHTLDQIKAAAAEGRLAYGFVEDLFPAAGHAGTLDEVAEATGLEPALIERLWMSTGLPRQAIDDLGPEDVQALQYMASVIGAGFPLVAFLQLTRVYGHALSQIADAEVRLFHMYVHEPLMREGVPALEMAEEMEHLARDLLPLASPIMDFMHQRFLQHYVEQDVVGHMEMDFDESGDLGRLTVTVAFADLAGYTRFTEEAGEEEALSFVERFVEAVTDTLPEEARLVKTIGDAVMIVSSEPGALVDWAVGFEQLWTERPLARIGLHHGRALYRDGDYFGRDVNLAARVVARARGGEVLVSDAVVDAAPKKDYLEFENIGQVKLKGFDERVGLCRVQRRR